MDFTSLLLDHGPYVAICLLITFMLTAAKRSFPLVFKTEWGTRCLYFAPALLGAALGLFLDEPLKLQILYGAACGTVSQSVYSVVTKALLPKAKDEGKATTDDDYKGTGVDDE